MISISEVTKLSPVPVKFVSKIEQRGIKNATYIGGFWDVSLHIEVLDNLNYSKTLSTLIHEISRAKCFKKNCKCRYTQSLSETHAYAFTLKWLLKNKYIESLRQEIKHLLVISKRGDYYGVAAKCIMKTRLWRKCVKYINKKSTTAGKQLLLFKI